MTARLAPLCVAISTARFTAAADPEITVCSGEFMLAGETTSFSAAFLQMSATSVGERPRIAAIAPWPAGTASCMYFPRPRTDFTAAENSTTACSHQRGIFTQAVAGDEIRNDSLLFQRAIGGDGNRQDSRLRIFSELQRFFGTFEAGFRDGKSQRGIGLIEDGFRFREICSEVAAHAAILRGLAGKQECEFAHEGLAVPRKISRAQQRRQRKAPVRFFR